MSFHTNYEKWLWLSEPRNCPVCMNAPMPPGMVDMVELPHAWLSAEPVAPLKGTCSLIARRHLVELYEFEEDELLGFMKEMQLCLKALKTVTGAIKMNFETHGNTVPHLHFRLYPRYLDDPFPGKAIDYQQTGNWFGPGEFEAFVEEMRKEMQRSGLVSLG